MGLTAIKPDGTASFEIAVDADGKLITSGGGGGGGGGDASAANQDEQTVVLEAIQAATETTALAGATEATLASVLTDTGNVSTATSNIDAKTPALGQAAMAASTPVVIATDQTTLQVGFDGTQSVVVTNAGQNPMASSIPVTLASDQSPVVVTDGGTPVYVDLAGVSMSFVPALDQQHLTPLGGTWTRANRYAAAASSPHSGSIISVSSGYLRSLRVIYTGALGSGLFVQLHDASALAGLTSSTIIAMGKPINTTTTEAEFPYPELLSFSNGLIAAFSTTPTTYTATIQTGLAEAHYV